MIKRLFLILFVAGMLYPATMVFAQPQYTIDLWEDGAIVPSVDATDTARVYVFLPQTAAPARRAVVICPGGGYAHLAIDNEGFAWAPYFNSMGIATIVLKYRMPHGDKRVPMSDAAEALRLVRAHAAEWNINPDDVGIMGSSAGGHLATTMATHADAATRPNFQILCYPVVDLGAATHSGSRANFLGSDATTEDEILYSNSLQVSSDTPRAIIMLSTDDDAVVPTHGVDYYKALRACGVPASLMVYPSGGHGWGMGTSFPYHADMLMNLRSWLNSF